MANDFLGPAIDLDMTELLDGVKKFDGRLDKGVAGVMEYWDSRMEAHMKTKAKWTDRTGNARNGLRAKAFHNPRKSHGVDLWHSVPYGLWLEVRWAGRYAIVIPTIKEYTPKVMNMLNKLFARLDGSR